MHPGSHQWHQLDLIIAKRDHLKAAHNTHSFHSADCDSDHSNVISKISLQPRKMLGHARLKCLPKINTAHTEDIDRNYKFKTLINNLAPAEANTSAEERWHQLSSTIHKSAIEAFVKKEKKSANWYKANLQIMEPAMQAKRGALIKWKSDSLQHNLNPRSNCQQLARECANNY